MISTDINPIVWYVIAHQHTIIIVLAILLAMAIFGTLFGGKLWGETAAHRKSFSAAVILITMLIVSFFLVQSSVDIKVQNQLIVSIEKSIGLKDVKLSKIAENGGFKPAIEYYGVGFDGDGKPRQFTLTHYGTMAAIQEVGIDSFENLLEKNNATSWLTI